jgi:hypothetical protein
MTLLQYHCTAALLHDEVVISRHNLHSASLSMDQHYSSGICCTCPAGQQREPYLAPKSPYKLSNIYILPTNIPRTGWTAAATNWTSQIKLSSARIELRWSNFPLVNVPEEVKLAPDSETSIKSGLPTRYLPETVEDEIPLPGYAQVGG